MKNTLIAILIILLIVFIGLTVYFYIGNQDKSKNLKTELDRAKLEIESIIQEKTTLEGKVASLEEEKTKALAYAEYLDIVISPFLRSGGITPRFTFSDDMKWLLEVEKRSDRFNNSELNDYLKKLEAHDQKAFGLILNWALGEIEETLK